MPVHHFARYISQWPGLEPDPLSQKHWGTASTGARERTCERACLGWGAEALGFSSSGSSNCSLPLAHGARGGLRGVTGDFPAWFRFAGAVEGREQRQGWLNSESKPLQSRTPQQEPGPISQWEIGSQFCQLGKSP